MVLNSPEKSVLPTGRDSQGFLQIARQVSETIGTEFFFTLANQLARVLDAKCVYIAEFIGGTTDRVRTLAAFAEGTRMEGFEFPLAGSPAAEVAAGSLCIYAKGVRETFPEDRCLHDLEVEAFVGVPLNNTEERATGLRRASVANVSA